MKIDPSQQVLQGYLGSTAAGNVKGANNTSGSNPPAQSDEVSISPEAQELQRFIQSARVTEDVNAERVAEIRTKLRTGSYVLDPQAIANKMLGLSSGGQG